VCVSLCLEVRVLYLANKLVRRGSMTVGALGFRLAEPNIIQEEESLEQEVETAKADENEDQTNSTPSRGEGEETMDADPWEQEPIQQRGKDDEMEEDTDHHDEFNGDNE